MKKFIIEFTVILITLFLLFKNNIIIKNNLIVIFNSFIKDVIPSMYPVIFLTTYIKHNIISKTKNKYIKYMSLLFSYAPSNAIIASSNNEIIFSTVINPLFSYVVLIHYFSSRCTFLIIIINMIINYICLFKNININLYIDKNKYSLTNIVKETTLNIINIFGVIIFFNIVISLLNIFINNKLLFLLEITNGFKIISSINSKLIRNILLIFLNSFGGTAIFFQIKSINNDANYYIIIKKFILSIFITLITILFVCFIFW